MILLLDIGNTNTHLGLANTKKVIGQADIPTSKWGERSAGILLKRFVKAHRLAGAILCSVVPRVTPLAIECIRLAWGIRCVELNPSTLRGVGVSYPKPETIGPDRLANAVTAKHC